MCRATYVRVRRAHTHTRARADKKPSHVRISWMRRSRWRSGGGRGYIIITYTTTESPFELCPPSFTRAFDFYLGGGRRCDATIIIILLRQVYNSYNNNNIPTCYDDAAAIRYWITVWTKKKNIIIKKGGNYYCSRYSRFARTRSATLITLIIRRPRRNPCIRYRIRNRNAKTWKTEKEEEEEEDIPETPEQREQREMSHHGKI